MSLDTLSVLDTLLCEESLPLHGFCSFDAVAGELHSCRALGRLKAAFSPGFPPKTVIVALFPYRQNDKPSNLSRYARVPDYHLAAGNLLKKTADRLYKVFSDYKFLPFIDNSPIPEVKAASLAGLGCIGDNGLFIHPIYGSWVFIGTITTDLKLPLPEQTITHCPHCGQCAKFCPGQCLGNLTARETCISHISQKKGTLSDDEERLLKKSGMAWGCDICQEVCPLNKNAQIEPHPCFDGKYTFSLTKEAITDMTDKAFGWRGQTILERNLSLIDEDWEKQYNK